MLGVPLSTWATGNSLTAGDLNSSFTTVGQTNMTFACLDDYSASAAQMRTTVDPYPSGAESLATTGQGEIERLRYISLHVFGATYWYTAPIENVNFRHRRVEMHMGAITGLQEMFVGQQTWSNAATRFHGVAFGVADQASHPESVLMRLHVGNNTKFMVSKLGDVHAATLALHQGGSLANPAIYHQASISTGIFFPTTSAGVALNHAAVSISGVEVARFHANGVVTPQLVLQHAASGRFVAIKAHATSTSNVVFTWPNSAGTAGAFMQTDGAGTLGFFAHGMPANVNILGNRNASGEFVQHGSGSGTAGTVDTAIYQTEIAITFPVAFSGTPKVLTGATTGSQNQVTGGQGITTTGFNLTIAHFTSGGTVTNASWLAIGP